jgi:outer membrane lipoprotein-sorting protein
MNTKLKLTHPCGLLMPPPGPVRRASASALDQFKSFVAGTKAARGEFTQTQVRKATAGKPPPPSSGTFVFARPGKFIWTYQKPYEQVLQADGETSSTSTTRT